MGETAHIAKKSRITKFKRWVNDERIFAYLLNIPSIFIIMLLVAYPIIYSFILSLYSTILGVQGEHALTGSIITGTSLLIRSSGVLCT